jgi:nicotinate-nucleotide--dimethylbenzimidazole phosphoribosyltransferase
MPADDFDHEVIDSPEALFRHLYEAHGVAEAHDVDPATAPLQFWLRKHSELERAARRAAAAERPENAQRAGDDVANPEGTPRLIAEPPGSARAPTSQPSARSGASTGPGPSSNRSGRVTHFGRDSGRSNAEVSTTGARSATPGPRFRPFTDPLIEAVAVALVGRGMDERSVRRGLSTFAGPGGRHGEAAVRDAFISPMLDEIAARLTGEIVGRPDRREPTITRDPRSESASWRNARQPDAAPPPPTPRGPLQPETRPSTPRDPSPTHQTPAATGPTGRTPAPTGRASETTSGAPAAGSQSASAELLAAWPIARPTSRTPGSGSPAASTPGPPASGSRQSSGSPRSRARDASASPGSRPSAEASPSKGSRPPSPPRAPVGAAAREARPAWSGPAEPTPEGIAPGDGAGWVTSSDADFMAIADVLQQRRKPRRAGRKDGTARSSRSDAEDDVMALADAIQRRPDRGGRRDRTR